jgi:hypothetical protein
VDQRTDHGAQGVDDLQDAGLSTLARPMPLEVTSEIATADAEPISSAGGLDLPAEAARQDSPALSPSQAPQPEQQFLADASPGIEFDDLDFSLEEDMSASPAAGAAVSVPVDAAVPTVEVTAALELPPVEVPTELAPAPTLDVDATPAIPPEASPSFALEPAVGPAGGEDFRAMLELEASAPLPEPPQTTSPQHPVFEPGTDPRLAAPAAPIYNPTPVDGEAMDLAQGAFDPANWSLDAFPSSEVSSAAALDLAPDAQGPADVADTDAILAIVEQPVRMPAFDEPVPDIALELEPSVLPPPPDFADAPADLLLDPALPRSIAAMDQVRVTSEAFPSDSSSGTAGSLKFDVDVEISPPPAAAADATARSDLADRSAWASGVLPVTEPAGAAVGDAPAVAGAEPPANVADQPLEVSPAAVLPAAAVTPEARALPVDELLDNIDASRVPALIKLLLDKGLLSPEEVATALGKKLD